VPCSIGRSAWNERGPASKMTSVPDVAEFELDDFVSRIRRGKTPIKSRLLEQKAVAGLGNIYADEALFMARLHPACRVLTREAAIRLHAAIKTVLREAVERRGTTFSLHADGLMREGDYGDSLKVFRRVGQLCTACGCLVCGVRVAGRSTSFCPTCQPLN
jgi:formamidopyrimidine-DNA glycosylase